MSLMGGGFSIAAGSITAAQLAAGVIPVGTNPFCWLDIEGATTSITGTGLTVVGRKGCVVKTSGAGAGTSRVNQFLTFQSTGNGAFDDEFSFDDDFILNFQLEVQGSAAGVEVWAGLRDATAADMINMGIGIKVTNLTISGEMYGAARTSITLSPNTLTSTTTHNIRIQKLDGTVTWYLDGTLVGTSTTDIPTGFSAGTTYMTFSVNNGAAATPFVNAGLVNAVRL